MPAPETQRAAIGEPSLELLGGSGIGASLQRAWLATRPQFLTASALPVFLGTAWGARQAGDLNLISCLLALLGVALLHAASNVWNDVGDEQCGTDSLNRQRIYPFTGGSRFIQNGVLSLEQMTRLSLSLAAGAVVVGILLTWRHGWPIVFLGVAGATIGALYSWPRVQLAGRGFGEIAVALAFGFLPVCGAAWLQQGTVDTLAMLLALPVSGWVAAVLLINEIPDREADARVGKRTLPVRLGARATGVLYSALHGLAFLGISVWQQGADLPGWPLGGFALLAGVGVLIGIGLAARRPELGLMIRLTLAVHAAGCIGLGAWLWWSGSPL